MEYMARLPPIMNEFQLVRMPHIPARINTFAMMVLWNAAAMASAVTKPVPLLDAAIWSPVIT